MKLQAVYPTVLQVTKEWLDTTGIEVVKEYIETVRLSGDYKNFEVRIANDVVKYGALYSTVGVNEVSSWYDKFGCHDDHLTTLCIRVMRDLQLI